MKKVIGVLLGLFFCSMASSQVMIALLFGDKLNTGKVEFGITVNPCFTDISDIESKMRGGFTLGIYFNIKLSEKFFIHIDGIAKGSFGAREIPPYSTGNDTLDQQLEDGDVERKIKAFGLPILARYRAGKKLYFDAGIQANWMLKSKDIFNAEVSGHQLDYIIPISDQITTLDFGLCGGFHYKFKDDRKSMGLGFRYYQGLTDILKPINGTQVNSAISFLLTIPVGVGKSAAAGNGTKSTGK